MVLRLPSRHISCQLPNSFFAIKCGNRLKSRVSRMSCRWDPGIFNREWNSRIGRKSLPHTLSDCNESGVDLLQRRRSSCVAMRKERTTIVETPHPCFHGSHGWRQDSGFFILALKSCRILPRPARWRDCVAMCEGWEWAAMKNDRVACGLQDNGRCDKRDDIPRTNGEIIVI